MAMNQKDVKLVGRTQTRHDIKPVPITDEDVTAVSEFLSTYHDDRVPWAWSCTAPWQVDAPNHGFMLMDGPCVVGTLLALYSERLLAGRVERFCNLGSWCVLPTYRSRSISLLDAILAQEGYHFTVLSPNGASQEVLQWLKFRFLDRSAALVPNLPWPALPGRVQISADPEVIESTLTGTDLEIYRDHAGALAAHHLVLSSGEGSCYVVYGKSRHRGGAILAVVHYVSDPAAFHRFLIPLTRYLLIRHGLVATVAERRIIKHMPRLAIKLNRRPKMYRSASLESGQIDDLYSELVCVPM